MGMSKPIKKNALLGVSECQIIWWGQSYVESINCLPSPPRLKKSLTNLPKIGGEHQSPCPHPFWSPIHVGGRLKLIIVYSSSTIIWGIINSTAMTQSFWQNFAILGGATFLYPVFIMLTSAVEMSWVFLKCDWHGNIRRDEPINCMYEKLFCSMRFNATSRTKNWCTVETSNLFWKKISNQSFIDLDFFFFAFLDVSKSLAILHV